MKIFAHLKYHNYICRVNKQNKEYEVVAILKKGVIHVRENRPDMAEIRREASRLKNGEYAFYICDKTPNKTLPRMTYLYGVVLKIISEELPDHPSVEVLYRKFEKMFAPKKVARVFRNEFIYQDLKNCSPQELDKVIHKIILFASENLGIELDKRLGFKSNELTEPYINAYNDQWSTYNRKV